MPTQVGFPSDIPTVWWLQVTSFKAPHSLSDSEDSAGYGSKYYNKAAAANLMPLNRCDAASDKPYGCHRKHDGPTVHDEVKEYNHTQNNCGVNEDPNTYQNL